MSNQFPEPMLNGMNEDDGEPSLPADL